MSDIELKSAEDECCILATRRFASATFIESASSQASESFQENQTSAIGEKPDKHWLAMTDHMLLSDQIEHKSSQAAERAFVLRIRVFNI